VTRPWRGAAMTDRRARRRRSFSARDWGSERNGLINGSAPRPRAQKRTLQTDERVARRHRAASARADGGRVQRARRTARWRSSSGDGSTRTSACDGRWIRSRRCARTRRCPPSPLVRAIISGASDDDGESGSFRPSPSSASPSLRPGSRSRTRARRGPSRGDTVFGRRRDVASPRASSVVRPPVASSLPPPTPR